MATDDLYPRIRAAIKERLALARAAPGRIWTAHREEDIAGASVYDEQWVLLYPMHYDHDEPMSNRPGATGPMYIERSRDQLAAFIAANDPAWVIRALEADLSRLDRHAPWPHEDAGLGCGGCGTDGAEWRYLWPCPEASALAALYLEEPE